MTYAHAAALGGGAPQHRHSPGRGVGAILAELLGPHPDEKHHQYGLVIDDIRCSELAYDVPFGERLEPQPREIS